MIIIKKHEVSETVRSPFILEYLLNWQEYSEMESHHDVTQKEKVIEKFNLFIF